MKPEPLIRRNKTSPDADMWHTLKVGLFAFVLLILPGLFVAELQLFPTPQEKLRQWLDLQLVAIQERKPQ